MGSLELSCRRRAKENVLYLLSLDARQKHPVSIRSLSMLPFLNKVPVTEGASSHYCDGFVGQVCMLEGRSESLVNVHEYEGHEEEKLLMKSSRVC